MLIQELEHRAAVLKDLGEHNDRLRQAYQTLATALGDIEQEHVAIQTLIDETPWLKDVNAGANTLAGLVAQTLSKHPGNGDLVEETTAKKLLVQDLGLPRRVYNCLVGERILTAEQLCQYRWSDLCMIPNLGQGGRQLIVDALAKHGLRIPDASVGPTPKHLCPSNIRQFDIDPKSDPVKKLGISATARQALAQNRIKTFSELRIYSGVELLQMPGFNKEILAEIRKDLHRFGLALKD